MAEASVIGLVLVATGVLGESVPARGTAPTPTVEAGAPASAGASVGDLVVSVTASPNQPGLNAFTVQATSTRRPQPAAVDGVALHWDLAGEAHDVSLHEVSPGLYFGTGTLARGTGPGASPVTLSIAVRRSGRTVDVHLPWSVPAPPVPAPLVPPGRRTAPYANGLAGGVLALGVAVAWVVARRRRPGPDAPRPSDRALEAVR